MPDGIELAVYAGLFLAAFMAATILPMQSEAVLVALLLTESYPTWFLVTVASVGNVAGSVVNWGLGRTIERARNWRYFPVKETALRRAQKWYALYGRWSLLLSWVPIVGDPLTVVAGVMRERFWFFLPLVTLAKTIRYAALAFAAIELAAR